MDEKVIVGLTNHILSFLQRNSGYLARGEIERLLGAMKADPKRLEPHGFKVYSQGDEDGIIEEICKRLDIKAGVFCEIGVENGLECNSLYLLHKGWRGGWIEGNTTHKAFVLDKFRSVIPSRLQFITGMVAPDNINPLIAEIAKSFGELDFLSIDIDGNDVYLLEALETRPKIICIEYNAKFPGALSKKPVYPAKPWQVTDYMGASLKAIADAAKVKDYRLVGTSITGSNAFFVRKDLAGDVFSSDSSPEYLYNPPRYWLIFDHFRNIGHPADFGDYTDLK